MSVCECVWLCYLPKDSIVTKCLDRLITYYKYLELKMYVKTVNFIKTVQELFNETIIKKKS